MQLNKSQVETILNNAPAGVDKKSVLDGLIQRGYDLEGVDNNAVRQNLQKEEQPVKESYFEEDIGGKLLENISNLIPGKIENGQIVPNENSPFITRANEVNVAIQNQPKLAEQAGGGPLAKIASVGATAGHIAGTIARGTFDIIGSIISPFIPKHMKQEIGEITGEVDKAIDSIPGMTPEIKKHIGDVFDTVMLLGGKKAEPVVKKTIATGTENIIKTGQGVAGDVGKGIKEISVKPAQIIEDLVKKPIPEQVKTVLNEIDTPTFDKYAKVAQEAAKSNKNLTPLEVAGKSAQDALDVIQRKLNNIGAEKTAIMEKANIGLQDVGNIVLKTRQQLENYFKNNTLVGGDKSLVNDIISKAKELGVNPKAIEVDKFIDYVQDRIYTGAKDLTVPVTSKTPAFVRQIIGELNGKLKTIAGDSYSGLNDAYANLIGIRNELNIKLGKTGERGGALMKRVFSPSDANTKLLFQQVKEITGIDLINESTIAKFVMETLGDARQLSLLEELKLPKLANNPLDFIWDRVTRSFNTPEQLLKRARDIITKGTGK